MVNSISPIFCWSMMSPMSGSVTGCACVRMCVLWRVRRERMRVRDGDKERESYKVSGKYMIFLTERLGSDVLC